jgi:hypothetical protein
LTSGPRCRKVIIDEKTLRFAGMLLVTSFDTSLLNPELHTKLDLTLKGGVERGHKGGFNWSCNTS